MFGPFLESWAWIKSHNPGHPFRKRHLNFITIHYLYILSLAILGSIIIYPAGNLAYIDALFFASGCATQSGLNTVDINTLYLYQQVIFYFLAMVATPIFINTFVVFVRLYWFERRFQNIVREARNFRRTRSRSRTKTEAKGEPDFNREEQGVRGRSIVVLHKGDQPAAGGTDQSNAAQAGLEKQIETDSSATSSSSHEDKPGSGTNQNAGQDETEPPHSPSMHREITFADEVDEVDELGELKSTAQRLPRHLSAEEHIAFLENQRNPKDKGTLRIPGPREFDRGHVPETLAEDEDGTPLTHEVTSPVDRSNSIGTPVKRNVTIDEPRHPRRRTGTGLSKISIPSQRTNLSDQRPGPVEELDDKADLPPAPPKKTSTFSSIRNWNTRDPEPVTPYLSWQPTIGRNSAFVDLTEEQREELGGIEYRSLKTLAIVLVSYYVLFHLLAAIIFLPWIVRSETFGSIVNADGINRVWWGIFTPASMFNDLGFTLTPDSMISFQQAVVPLLIGTFLIIIGNTGFPCMLRFTIWLISKFLPRESGVWEEFRFLLDHPRRCFTLLFPNKATWWLFWILVVLNGLDLIFFLVLDLHDPVVTEIGSTGYRILNGLFQASSTRTAGFSTVNLFDLHPGIQVSYMVMMYISVFPIAISVRRTNVYEEKSLGIYTNSNDQTDDDNEPSYVGAHLRRQLSFDLWYIFLGLFIIAIAEGSHIQNTNEFAFTMYSCLFEIVSAYGTVGLSLGYPTANTSFSGQFTVISKLVIIAMQIRGRHRGLPYELDRAILLPSESLHKKEDADAAKRVLRRNSSISAIEPIGTGLSAPPPMNRTPTQKTENRRDSEGHGMSTAIMGEHGHSGMAGTAVGKLMAGFVAGPRLDKKEKYVIDPEKPSHHIAP